MMTQRNRAAGFTLIEVVIIVAILGILAAAIAPAILQQVVDAKVTAAKSSTKALYEAMVGKEDVKGSYGFLGDMGRFPSTADELVRPSPGTPMYTGNGKFRSVAFGWNGPYVTLGDNKDGTSTDAWGHAYRINPTGQVRSAGPDGVYDSPDDIVYPPEPPKLTSRVMVSVKRQDAEGEASTLDPTGYEVRLYYSFNGQEAFLASKTAPFAFDYVYPGLHAIAVVRVSNNQIVAQDTVEVPANTTKLVTLFFRP